MNTANLIRRALALVFLGALLIGGFGSYFALKARAFEDAARESRLLLNTALAIRGYTIENIAPLLNADGYNGDFHAETVPSRVSLGPALPLGALSIRGPFGLERLRTRDPVHTKFVDSA